MATDKNKRRDAWSREEAEYAARLRVHFKSLYLAGRVVGRSETSVNTILNRRQLWAPIEKPQRHNLRWTDRDRQTVLAAVAGGVPVDLAALAASLDRSPDSVVALLRIERIDPDSVFACPEPPPANALPRLAIRAADATKRKCLRCREDFLSEGVWNHVCAQCKRPESYDDTGAFF